MDLELQQNQILKDGLQKNLEIMANEKTDLQVELNSLKKQEKHFQKIDQIKNLLQPFFESDN